MGEQGDRGRTFRDPPELDTPDRFPMMERLFRGTVSEVLARLAADDPLRLYELGARRCRERYFLFDADLLFERLVARVAYVGAQVQPLERGADWLVRQVDHVLDQWIDDEREEEVLSPFDCPPEDPRYAFLRSVWVEPRFARAASLAFSTLPDRTRRVFFFLMLEKRSVEDALALGLWTEEDLMRDCWRVLGALGLHDANSQPDPDWQLRP